MKYLKRALLKLDVKFKWPYFMKKVRRNRQFIFSPCFEKEGNGEKNLFYANFPTSSVKEKPNETRSYRNNGSDTTDVHSSKNSFSNLVGLTSAWDIYHSDRRSSVLIPAAAPHKRSCDSTNRIGQLHLSPLTVRTYGATLKSPPEPSTKDSDSYKNNSKSYTSSVCFEVKPVSTVTLDLRTQLRNNSDDMQTTMPRLTKRQLKSFSDGYIIDKHLLRLGKGMFSSSTITDNSASFGENMGRLVPLFIIDSSDEKSECKTSGMKNGENMRHIDEGLLVEAKLIRQCGSTVKSYLNSSESLWLEEKEDYFGKAIPLKVGQVSEVMQTMPPLLSPIPSERAEKLTATLPSCSISKAINISPHILQQKCVVAQAPLSFILHDISLDDESPNGQGAHFDMPPERSAVPESPYVSEVISYQGTSSKSLAKVLFSKKKVRDSDIQNSSPSLQMEDNYIRARETLERINKLRSILHTDESIHSLVKDKSVQIDQPPRKKLMISRVDETDQPQSDLWDTATVSDSLADSFNHLVVENYIDSGKLSQSNPQHAQFQECSQFNRALKTKKFSLKPARSRREPKQTDVKANDRMNPDLSSGAPFMVGRLARSNLVGERCQDSPSALLEVPLMAAPGRWEDCINQLYAKCRQNSASVQPRVLLGQKRVLRNSCSNETRSNRQEVRSSLLRQTFSSAQRCRPNQRSLLTDIFASR